MHTSLTNAINRHPPTIAAAAVVPEAIALLSQSETPCILVIEADSRLLGVFAERDVVRLTALGIDLTTRCVSTVMTHPCLTLNEAELQDPDSVLTLFEQNQLSALPIVNDQGQSVGLITSNNLLRVLSFRDSRHPEESRDRQRLDDDRKKAETALRRQLKRALLLQKITDAIRAQSDPRQIFETTVTQVGQVFGASYCHLAIYTPTPTFQLAMAAQYSISESPIQMDEILLTENFYTLSVLTQDQAIASSNVYADLRLEAMESQCQQIGLKSLLTVRTSYQGQPNGMLTLHQCDRFRQWTNSEIQLLEEIAAQVGIALAQIRLLEQEKKQREAIAQQNLLLQQEIRDRQAALRDLQHAEERLELFFSQSLDGFFFMMLDQPVQWDDTIDHEKTIDYVFAHHRVTKVNDAMLEQYGASREQFLGLMPADFFAHDLMQGRQIWRQLFDAGKLHIETQERKLDGTPIWIEGDYICLYNAQGRITGHFGIQRDVSDRKKLELALQSSESKLSSILNSVPAAIASLSVFPDERWIVDYRSAGYAKLFGFSIEEYAADSNLWMSQLDPEDLERYFTQIRRDILAEQNGKIEYRFRHADGNWRWLTETYTVQWDDIAHCWIVFTVDTDITNRKQAEEAVQRQQEFLRNVIDIPPNLIFAKDWNGKFVLANQATAEIYGTTVEDLIDKNDADFNSNRAEVEQFLQDDREVISTGQPKMIEESVTATSGETRCFQTIKKPITSIDGQSTLVLGIATDISDLKQAEAALAKLLAQTQEQSIALEKARDAAESANRAKSEFLANMSHELRTPLNAILGFTQIMSHDTLLNSENREYVNIINRSGQHLLTLINDVLEMSKIEAGRLKLYSTCFDLHYLLDTLYQLLYLKARSKQLLLTFHCPSHLPQYITTDEGKLRQVLLNLLGNAIKFTPQGSVTLRVDVNSGGVGESESGENLIPSPLASPFTLSFEVEDTGPGIAPDDLQRLFKPFVQTLIGQQYSEGTGLGLTISQKFVQLMGGKITVASVVNQGSLFRFDIQADLAQAFSPFVPYSTQTIIGLAPDQPPYRLLIVEDRRENQQILVKLLQPLGFDVQVAINGQEGVAVWEQWHPHVILMDMRMPVMNGYEATQQIRAKELLIIAQSESSTNPPPNMTKIIAVTSSAFNEERSAILDMGCDDFISKPFREEEIFAKLAQHLGVQYVYESKDAIGLRQELQDSHLSLSKLFDQGAALDASSLNGMPAEWIEQLHKAAVLGKDKQMLQLIEQLPSTDLNLVEILQELIRNFHFEAIVELTKPTQE